MPTPQDRDPTLAALQEELRVQLTALNRLYHPVYPASGERIAAAETEIAELRRAIRERREQLARPSDAAASTEAAGA